MLLTALGYDSNEIGLFLRQPIMKRLLDIMKACGAKNNSLKKFYLSMRIIKR